MDSSSTLLPLNQIPTGLLAPQGSALEAKVRAAQNAGAEKQKQELRKASEQFESIFIAYLLKVMRETIEESGSTEGGFGKSIYTELFDQEISNNMAKRGTLGIADLLYRNLSTKALNQPQPGNTESPDSPGAENPPTDPPGSVDQSRRGVPPRNSGDLTRRDAASTLTAIPGTAPEISDLHLPVSAPISSAFGPRRDPFSHQIRFHKGVDLAAPEGMQVVAPLPGTVISAGYQQGYGNTVVIQHSGGLQTRYGHLEMLSVKAGDVVSSEEVLGQVGNTGRSTGPHLHFEVIRMGKQVDPAAEFKVADLHRRS